jgi:hypothetical protein
MSSARIPLMLPVRLRLAPWWLARQPRRRPWHSAVTAVALGVALIITVAHPVATAPACPWRMALGREAAGVRPALARVCPAMPAQTQLQAGP